MTEEEILAKLEKNFNKAVLSVPKLALREFTDKLFTPKQLKDYAKDIFEANESNSAERLAAVESKIKSQFALEGYGRRMIQAGVEPKEIYDTLVEGLFKK